ncbi:DUF6777 domain-containing protein [Streptomyces sp. ISL-86]|uniref:DUF6777 domain-containing protein n=1 Tax=Streptomyces sp. ISL-86 TaxID=2819187 RepID=UPI0027E558C0|nr:DUF6777 domain-containing protein [Streptomyces sp. ISL-86]
MPKLATALVAVAAAVALAVVLTRPSGSPSANGEVFLQPVSQTGPDPFTESVALKEAPLPDRPTPSGTSKAPPTTAAPTTAVPTTAPTTGMTATRSISGAAPGVYGGTKDSASCDVEKQIRLLSGQSVKNAAFASTLGIQPAAVPGYLRSLTPVQLGMDTRVTNHGYRDGKASSYQAVLQAGTAVLVDDRGVPRVRCACGNPLGSPVALKENPKRYGQPWTSYQPAKVVVIAPSVTIVNKFVIYDHEDRHWYERDRGEHHKGKHDKPVPPPAIPTPTWSSGMPTDSWNPTRTPSWTPTGTKTGSPTDTKTGSPTDTKTGSPTDTKTGSPTDTSTGSPTGPKTGSPTDTSTGSPTDTPTYKVTSGKPSDKVTTEPPTGKVTTEPPTGKVTTEPPSDKVTTEPPSDKVTTSAASGSEESSPESPGESAE